MKAKTKRFLTLTSMMAVFFVGCTIIFYNLKNNLVFFFSPSEISKQTLDNNRKIRVGGMVKENSLLKEIIHKDNQKIQKISFIITDFKNEVLVNYEGILPDLFKEGQGVVVEGILIDHLSVNAINVLAKHDENYMPPELDFVNTSEKGKN
ncbi:MAG: cytochrome c maturation protein CcmE [Rickettsiales bacterium]|nr:cytochrome c maturation protein CcmE [Rickettsiales bacterium]|tara:strand:- start:329 stop:778 length:450 start_codon:yes stop_codon:yes gene_type:complete